MDKRYTQMLIERRRVADVWGDLDLDGHLESGDCTKPPYGTCARCGASHR